VILEIPRRDPSRESREDTYHNPRESQNSENQNFQARRNLVTRNRDPRIRDKIRTVYISGHVAEICAIGESPDKE
jgi:hypothetical protein